MKTTEKQNMYDRIRQHGENLLAIFPNATEQDPIKLCKKLRRLESQAHEMATSYCKGVIDPESWEKGSEYFKRKIQDLLSPDTGKPSDPVYSIFINGDARGYALKIDDQAMRGNEFRLHTDWGGYGILAPDLA